jgi:hypothetical protein
MHANVLKNIAKHFNILEWVCASDIYRYLNFNVSPIHIDILVLVSLDKKYISDNAKFNTVLCMQTY